jgi:hypothetical protein
MGSIGFTVGRRGEPMAKAPGGPDDTPRLGSAGGGVRIEVVTEATSGEERRPRAGRMEEGAVRGEESGQGRRWREFAGRRCGHAENLGAGGAGPGKGETRSRLITAGAAQSSRPGISERTLASASISPEPAQRARQPINSMHDRTGGQMIQRESQDIFFFFVYFFKKHKYSFT